MILYLNRLWFSLPNWLSISALASQSSQQQSIFCGENIIFVAIFFEDRTNTWHIVATQLIFWRRQWQPTPVLLPGKSHGWRSLVGCSPWGRKELDMTERLHSHFSLSCIGEGNGNPLQCSCLENPRDGGAWRAAVYGVA